MLKDKRNTREREDAETPAASGKMSGKEFDKELAKLQGVAA